MSRRSSSRGLLATNVVAGLVGGLVASYVMERFQAALSKLSEDEQRQSQDEPATYKAADAASRAIIGHGVRREDKPFAGSIVHYAFGGAVGAIYGAAAAQRHQITAWGGVPFGATLWLVADEIGVPAAGLSRAPTEYPLSNHLSAFAAHLVYGATTETVRKLLTLRASRGGPRADVPRTGAG